MAHTVLISDRPTLLRVAPCGHANETVVRSVSFVWVSGAEDVALACAKSG